MGLANLGRGTLAKEVGIDKSVVARWLGDKVRPSEPSLVAVTQVIARRLPDLSLADWSLPLARFGERLGARELPPAEAEAPGALLMQAGSWTADDMPLAREAYPGLWLALYHSTQGLPRIAALPCAM